MKNAVLTFHDWQQRGTRYDETTALLQLASHGYGSPVVLRRSVSRDGRTETIVTRYTDASGRNATLRITFSI